MANMFDAGRWPGHPPRAGTTERPLRLGILISGRGSNMLSILQRQQMSDCHHSTMVVLSDCEDAPGLISAKENGVPAHPIQVPLDAGQVAEQIADDLASEQNGISPLSPATISRRIEHEIAVDACLSTHDVELVVLAGYMRIFTPWFIRRYLGRLINIHPSLLPDFPGPHAARDALEENASRSGCTVHHVDEGVDTGPIIAQASILVEAGDTETTLLSRIQTQEHILYPAVLDAIATHTPIMSDGLMDLRLP
ncbi:MAG TPA: phosphoribosylglycinamide formyltransferase [Candidatus Poseidoniales archaeon]|nr:phosphoribosylglycinamide formyltransferase [Candidatus Poseidoniales archaeon]